VFLYLPQEHQGPRLGVQLKAQLEARAKGETYAGERGPPPGQSQGMRHYGIGAQVLRALGLGRIRLMSNNPIRLKAIHGFGLDIVDVVPIPE
jgi:3,4-dihydroxy 2-butanone 4-phosphate synthase/GTP cyclohydrolase II